MPNEITNYLTLTGSAGSLKKFKEKAVGPSPLYRLDEYTNQQLKKSGTQAADQKRRAARAEKDEVFQFHKFIPIPKHILEASFDERGYDWEFENWGVKWGAIDPKILDDETDSSKLVYKFRTAWVPPSRFLEVVGRQFPELLFTCEFLDFEQPYLPARIIEYKNGQLIADRPGSPIEEVITDWVDGIPKEGYVRLLRDHS